MKSKLLIFLFVFVPSLVMAQGAGFKRSSKKTTTVKVPKVQTPKVAKTTTYMGKSSWKRSNNNYNGTTNTKIEYRYINNVIVDSIYVFNEKDLEDFRDAKEKNTKRAYMDFVEEHPNSDYYDDAHEYIKDFENWEQADRSNTISAVDNYLRNSTKKACESQARAKLAQLRAQYDREWENCEAYNDIRHYEDFINNYSDSEHKNEAQYNLNVLKGMDAFARGKQDEAFVLLDKANKEKTLTGTAADNLNSLKAEREYKNMLMSNDVNSVDRYFKSLSYGSQYYTPIGNHLAILLAKKIDGYSSDADIDYVKSLANDEESKRIVYQAIKTAKERRAQIEKARRDAARKEWWRNRFKVGWNVLHVDYLDNFGSLGTGVKFRFGRYSDFVNLVFGAEYSYTTYMETDDWDDEEFSENFTTVSHAVDIPVGLRFNLFKVSANTKFYIGCDAVFGIKLADGEEFKYLEYYGDPVVNKSTFAIQPQLGFQSNNLDFGLYYKSYSKPKGIFHKDLVDDMDKNANNRVGMFLTWYF